MLSGPEILLQVTDIRTLTARTSAYRLVSPFGERLPASDAVIGREHRAVREGVALIDQSSFSKFEVTGPGALRYLRWLAAANIDCSESAVTYTQLLNTRGGIEADLTIMQRREDRFHVVTGSAFGTRDGGWIRRPMPRDGSVHVQDATGAYGVINLCGPLSRDILARASENDVGNSAFPYMTCQGIRIGWAPVMAARVTYVGELGWELHMPTEYMAYVYEQLKRAGAEFGIVDIGYKAISSLRMEKRYLYWGAGHGSWSDAPMILPASASACSSARGLHQNPRMEREMPPRWRHLSFAERDDNTDRHFRIMQDVVFARRICSHAAAAPGFY